MKNEDDPERLAGTGRTVLPVAGAQRRRPSRRVIPGGVVLVLLAVGVALMLAGSREPAEIRSATISSDDLSLAVEYVAPDQTCGGEPRVSAKETDSEVIITVEIHKPFELGSRTCLLRGRLLSADVELVAPLGDRPLIDGSTTRPIPVVGPE